MGLDMYLEGVRYIPEEKDKNGKIIKRREVRKTLLLDWRKNYPIHSYFHFLEYHYTLLQMKHFYYPLNYHQP